MKPNKTVSAVGALAVLLGYGIHEGMDRYNAYGDAKSLQTEAGETYCELQRAAIGDILGDTKGYGIPPDKVQDFKRQAETLASASCNDDGKRGGQELTDQLLTNILNSNPNIATIQQAQPEKGVVSKDVVDAFTVLGDVQFLKEVGVKSMSKTPRVVSAVSIRLGRDQREVMKTFMRRAQSR